ncbi:receptor-like protein EIX1 [Solanum stenotomum]|uniref:receptor-like protein EIX1 n=1 Tax=Solanum stenotomum TaxID=172797 RepID=UPI0020D16D39|nr:receptor-like protein EIX1 [Solanum stenotomum]
MGNASSLLTQYHIEEVQEHCNHIFSQQEILSLYQRFCQLDINSCGFVSGEEFLSKEAYHSGKLNKSNLSDMKGSILDLLANGLSGEIPHCNNFTLLYQDDSSGEPMGFNIQVGGISKEIAEMRRLQSLNFSRNVLNGSVIEGIGQMKMLESLDLSRNNLSGVIPQGLANLTFLSVLDLSNNHLSGRIPSSTQLQCFDRPSYSYNAQLYGPPLQECPGYSPPKPHIDHGSNTNPQEHDNDEEFPYLEFYISMVIGFFVTF